MYGSEAEEGTNVEVQGSNVQDGINDDRAALPGKDS
jgi:hypothetical protein